MSRYMIYMYLQGEPARESFCQRNAILNILVNMLETKNLLRLWMGGTFLAMISKKLVKGVANVGGCYPILPWRLKHRAASGGNSNF